MAWGKLTLEERRERRRESLHRYNSSEKGHARNHRYNTSENGHVRYRRYRTSERGRAADLAHKHARMPSVRGAGVLGGELVLLPARKVASTVEQRIANRRMMRERAEVQRMSTGFGYQGGHFKEDDH